ncbi:MAG: division/cell wall cluster transcriptional repressor MraZ [Phycisphaerales bacterium]
MIFAGEHEHTIDSQQRLAIPAMIRNRMERAKLEPEFILLPGPPGSIWIWPERTFEQMSELLDPSLMPEDELIDFDELTYPNAQPATLDSAGRIRVPEEMLAEAGLGKRVVVIGMRDHIELRDPEAWAATKAAKRTQRPQIINRARAMLRTRAGTPSHRAHRGGEGERDS